MSNIPSYVIPKHEQDQIKETFQDLIDKYTVSEILDLFSDVFEDKAHYYIWVLPDANAKCHWNEAKTKMQLLSDSLR